MKIFLANETETAQLGAELWRLLPEKCLIFLNGQLGAGKTTLTRGVLRAAGYTKAVKSPTYTLVEEYEVMGRIVFHFDLYRLKDPEELEWMGFSDYLAQPSLCFIEWAELGKGFIPEPDIRLNLSTEGDGRVLEIEILAKYLIGKINLHWKNNNILL